MLHAFRLDENTSTSDTEIGGVGVDSKSSLRKTTYLKWAGRLIDQMVYGRTFLFDGSPIVEDVWIDEDGDNARRVTPLPMIANGNV